jgi:hypothetical protein
MINYLEKYLKYKLKYQQLKNQIGGKIVDINTEYKGKNFTVRVPEDFICPLTKKIILDPVVTVDGQIYEKSAISNWFIDHRTSPLTGLRLKNTKLTSIPALKKSIEDIIEEQYNNQLDQQIGELERLSNAGDCNAQYQLFLKYSSGEGLVVKNLQRAMELLKTSSARCETAKKLLQSFDFKDCFFKEYTIKEIKRLFKQLRSYDDSKKWYKSILKNHPFSDVFLKTRISIMITFKEEVSDHDGWCSGGECELSTRTYRKIVEIDFKELINNLQYFSKYGDRDENQMCMEFNQSGYCEPSQEVSCVGLGCHEVRNTVLKIKLVNVLI